MTPTLMYVVVRYASACEQTVFTKPDVLKLCFVFLVCQPQTAYPPHTLQHQVHTCCAVMMHFSFVLNSFPFVLVQSFVMSS